MTSTTDSFDDDYNEYDEFDDAEERGVSGLVVLLIIVAMIGAFAFIVMLAFNKGVRQGELGNTPYVAADPEPVKTVAAGTAATQPENREVYDRFDGNTNPRTEVLGAGPEEPIVSDGVDQIAALAAGAQDEVLDTLNQNGGNASVNAGQGSENGVRYEPPQTEKLTSIIDEAVTDTTAKVDSGSAEVSTGTTSVTPAAATPSTTPSLKSPPATQSATTATSSGATGTHVVQVGAFRSQAEADAQWGRLGNNLGSFLDGKVKDVERADLGDKGIFYRLRIGGFTSAAAAKTYCEGLKTRKQDCLVKAR